MVLVGSPTRLGYAAVFIAAAIACFASLVRARRIDDAGTRRGLVALLVTSGGWAAAQAGFVSLSTERFAASLYSLGLLFGFATVFAWLYFVSAYTGRSYHRQPTYRYFGLALYLVVAAVKLTNPVHQLYFTTAFVADPVPHLVIEQGPIHWVTTALSYALATVGIFALFERFAEADYDTRVLGVLVGLTGLPVVLDVIGYASPALLDIIYAPLGVAAFAVGVLFVAEERFLTLGLAGDTEGAVVLLDDTDRIRDYNRTARELLPELADAVGEPIGSIGRLAAIHDADGDATGADEGVVLELDVEGETRYYLVTADGVSLGRADLGRVVVFADITAIERQRRELERHNDQLDGFAIWMRHELRNALTVVGGYTDWATEAIEAGNREEAREALDTVSAATDRMTRIVADLATLAQHGRTIEGTSPVDFRETIAAAWAATDTDDLTLTIAGEGTIEAEGTRLRELFENGFSFFTHTNGSALTVSLRTDGFRIADNGERPPPDATERYFDYGDAAPTASAGMALPNVRTLARVHGWTATVDPEYREGTCLVVAGAVVREISATA